MSLSPVIVFCYNRPLHVKKTLEALSQNELADLSVLYVFCDGPKVNASNEQRQKILQTREVVHSKQWCKEVHVVEAESNKGLAKSIIGGVTDVINKYGRVIVVEDDLVTSPDYLTYMNRLLDHYEKFPAVFSVTGDCPVAHKMHFPADYDYDVFVSLRSCSYVWGTWKDRWDKVDWNMNYWGDFSKDVELINAFNRGGLDLTPMLRMQHDGEIDSWSIRFSFAHFMHHAVTIMPVVPYIKHIGMDGSGTHCAASSVSTRGLCGHSKNIRLLDILYEDSRIVNAFYNAYNPTRRIWYKRVINFLSRKLGLKAPFVIKYKVYTS